MERWDRREKSIDEETKKEIMDEFKEAKARVDSCRYRKREFLIGLDLISKGKRIDAELDFWETRLEKLCKENYELLKSKDKDIDKVMKFFSEKMKEKMK